MKTQLHERHQETWVKVLGRGVITIPKAMREQVGMREGEIAKARVVGKKIVIEPQEGGEHLRVASGLDVLLRLARLGITGGPADLSTNHDHYLYGGPKKPEA